jgi:hypothetical protein
MHEDSEAWFARRKAVAGEGGNDREKRRWSKKE